MDSQRKKVQLSPQSINKYKEWWKESQLTIHEVTKNDLHTLPISKSAVYRPTLFTQTEKWLLQKPDLPAVVGPAHLRICSSIAQ